MAKDDLIELQGTVVEVLREGPRSRVCTLIVRTGLFTDHLLAVPVEEVDSVVLERRRVVLRSLSVTDLSVDMRRRVAVAEGSGASGKTSVV